ncbi:hypothetical protein HK098_008061 [Nowakowskiella sp. JEL0407]|nr:hypothetical protein HK098_008061 [Nowakowskiella sp. JEL0407]
MLTGILSLLLVFCLIIYVCCCRKKRKRGLRAMRNVDSFRRAISSRETLSDDIKLGAIEAALTPASSLNSSFSSWERLRKSSWIANENGNGNGKSGRNLGEVKRTSSASSNKAATLSIDRAKKDMDKKSQTRVTNSGSSFQYPPAILNIPTPALGESLWSTLQRELIQTENTSFLPELQTSEHKDDLKREIGSKASSATLATNVTAAKPNPSTSTVKMEHRKSESHASLKSTDRNPSKMKFSTPSNQTTLKNSNDELKNSIHSSKEPPKTLEELVNWWTITEATSSQENASTTEETNKSSGSTRTNQNNKTSHKQDLSVIVPTLYSVDKKASNDSMNALGKMFATWNKSNTTLRRFNSTASRNTLSKNSKPSDTFTKFDRVSIQSISTVVFPTLSQSSNSSDSLSRRRPSLPAISTQLQPPAMNYKVTRSAPAYTDSIAYLEVETVAPSPVRLDVGAKFFGWDFDEMLSQTELRRQRWQEQQQKQKQQSETSAQTSMESGESESKFSATTPKVSKLSDTVSNRGVLNRSLSTHTRKSDALSESTIRSQQAASLSRSQAEDTLLRRTFSKTSSESRTDASNDFFAAIESSISASESRLSLSSLGFDNSIDFDNLTYEPNTSPDDNESLSPDPLRNGRIQIPIIKERIRTESERNERTRKQIQLPSQNIHQPPPQIPETFQKPVDPSPSSESEFSLHFAKPSADFSASETAYSALSKLNGQQAESSGSLPSAEDLGNKKQKFVEYLQSRMNTIDSEDRDTRQVYASLIDKLSKPRGGRGSGQFERFSLLNVRMSQQFNGGGSGSGLKSPTSP